MLSTPVALHFC